MTEHGVECSRRHISFERSQGLGFPPLVGCRRVRILGQIVTSSRLDSGVLKWGSLGEKFQLSKLHFV